MTENQIIANEILKQLGGNKFITMTGSKNFLAIENGISMKLTRNGSKANMLEIKLNGKDLYDVRFYRYSGGRMNMKTLAVSPVKFEDVEVINDVYFDQLQEIFTRVTGLYTRLF
jgi:hypothetical protein